MMSFLAFLGVATLVIITPGPDTAITVRNALLGGRVGGIFTALGVAIGQAIWALATSIGVVAVLVACEPLFLAIKYAGAVYLVFLGLQALRDMMRASAPADTPRAAQRRRLSPNRALRQGIISDLSNPKMAVFFVSLLPQFAPFSESGGGADLFALLALGLVFSLMTFCWLACYSLAVAKAGDFLRRGKIRRIIDGITGSVLLALGLRAAVSDR
jgi:threonine/homoserine/homoserine lactone efflux protein